MSSNLSVKLIFLNILFLLASCQKPYDPCLMADDKLLAKTGKRLADLYAEDKIEMTGESLNNAKCALIGSLQTQMTAAKHHFKGHGKGSRSEDKWTAFYTRLAADKGDVNAQYMLGLFYLKGDGVEKDLEKALFYIFLSYRQGFVPARNRYFELLDLVERKKALSIEARAKIFKPNDNPDFIALMKEYGIVDSILYPEPTPQS